MRPPPLIAFTLRKDSVVSAVEEPRTEKTPPWTFKLPPSAPPRRLLRFAAVLSATSVPPA